MPRRDVKSFDEANQALRDIYLQLDTLRTQNIDLNKRRVINAHPSEDDYDYVVRKELHDAVGGSLTPRVAPKNAKALTYDKITFGLGIGRSVVVGDYVTPPYIWTNSANGKADVIAVAANTPPTGSDLLLDIKQNGTSIFTSGQFVFPAGTAARTPVHSNSTAFRSGLLFKRFDIVTIHVTQVGATVAGQEIEVVVFCKLS